jgi:hypothetical protein
MESNVLRTFVPAEHPDLVARVRPFEDGDSVMGDEFPPVSCLCCGQFSGSTYTVPLRLIPPGKTAWQDLCADCFRSELGTEPWDDLLMRPIRHGSRSRRR